MPPECRPQDSARSGASGADERRVDGSTLVEARRSFEREWLLAKLGEHGGNISRTAAAIGIARESLSRKIKAFGIEVERG
jgi:two-component system nitrogen regulation response regulator NtrX